MILQRSFRRYRASLVGDQGRDFLIHLGEGVLAVAICTIVFAVLNHLVPQARHEVSAPPCHATICLGEDGRS